MGGEDILWAGIPFIGGIGGRQDAPCGAVSAGALSIGILNRAPISEKQNAKVARHRSRLEAMGMVGSFSEEFGNITCRDLIGLDFLKPGEYQKFLESGVWKEKCVKYVQFVVEKIFSFEEGRGVDQKVEKVTIYTKPGCKFCEEAMRDMKERGVPYDEISIEASTDAKDTVMRLSEGSGIVPVIVTEGGDVKVGFGGG
jgi:glutaredoxin